MAMIKLHLVGGFLGSGKTTAIIAAAKILLAKGMKVGVVTNDQGKYLVDTAFMQLERLPAVEVAGGCFCCNYDDHNQQLLQLIQNINPDVIFAESVGSCADIVATVVKPLLTIGDECIQPSSFSVFVDSRLFLHHLTGEPLPFSEDVVYIFEKQIEEAGLLVINKIDLLSQDDISLLKDRLQKGHYEIPHRLQNSLSANEVTQWVDQIQQSDVYLPKRSLEMDYDRYGRGEAQMAWLDARLTLTVSDGDDPRQAVLDFLQHLLDQLQDVKAGIGHLKFVLQCGELSTKISFTSVADENWQAAIPVLSAGEIQLLVNARVETLADLLRRIFQYALQLTQSEHAFSFKEDDLSFFHPGKPEPTHRMP
jgi:G3E family GTPase